MKKLMMIVVVVIALKIVIGLITGPVNYYNNGDNYYYTMLSMKNGIDISRWYAELKGVDPVFTRALFNKVLIPVFLVMKNITVLFE